MHLDGLVIEPHKELRSGAQVFHVAVTSETEEPEEKSRVRPRFHPEEPVLIEEVSQPLPNHSGAGKGFKETGHHKPGVAR